MPENYISLNIRHLRKKINYTQGELGKYLGVSDSQVTNYEKGKSSPPLDSVLKMCELFNVNLERFVFKRIEFELIADKSELKSEITEGCLLPGGCALRRVVVLEGELAQLKKINPEA